MRTERASVGLTLIDGLYVLLGAALALASAWPIYQHPQMLVVGGVGIGVGLLCAIGGRLLRLPWWADLLAAIALYLLVAVPVAIPSAFPDRWLSGLRDAVFGVVGGWKEIVTVELPLGTYQAVLIPLLVIMLFGTYAAARVAVSTRRVQVVVPVILIAMFGFGIAFGSSQLGAQYAPGRIPILPYIGVVSVAQVFVAAAILLVVLSLIWLAVRARRARAEALARASGIAQSGVAVKRASGWAVLRRGLLAAAMVAVAVVGAGFVAVPAAQAERSVIRDQVKPFELISQQASPLSGYRDWISDDRYDAELFTVDAPESVDRLRLAVMDTYDGTRFTISNPTDGSRFTRIKGASASGGAPITVTVGPAYGEPWVPLPGDRTGSATFPGGGNRAVELEDALYYSTDDSLAVVLAGRADGTIGFSEGDRVSVSGQPEAGARDRIAAASGGSPINNVSEDVYPNLIEWVKSQNAGSGGAGLLTLIDRLRMRGYLSHGLLQDENALWLQGVLARDESYQFKESRAGHSAARIEALFDQLNERQRQAGGAPSADGTVTVNGATSSVDASAYVAGVGDDEQFATAAALLAWSQGIPARVVLGVRLHDEPASDAVPAEPAVQACASSGTDTYSCRGQNVSAWIEVNVGGQWLPIDTSPQFTLLPAENNEGENPPAHGTLPERPASNVIDPPSAARTQIQSQAAEDAATGPVLSQAAATALRIVAVGGTAAGLLLIPPGILIGAKSLRRARRRSAQPEVAIVGAWEEFIDECVDLRLLPRAAGGTRTQLADRLDDPVARQLAAVADRAVFGATAPVESDSHLAWVLVRDEQRRLRQEMSRWERLRGLLNPASLIRHLRPKSARLTLQSDPGGDAR